MDEKIFDILKYNGDFAIVLDISTKRQIMY